MGGPKRGGMKKACPPCLATLLGNPTPSWIHCFTYAICYYIPLPLNLANKQQATSNKQAIIPLQVRQDWNAGCRRMRKIGRLVHEDLCLQDLVHLAPDPTTPVPRPLPTLVDIMWLHDSLQQLGRLYARQQERERLRKWCDKMGEALLNRPKEVYKWIKNEFQPPRSC